MNDEDKKKLEKFENEVIGRLFVLNAKRAEEENVATSGATAKRKPAPKRAKKAEPDQLSMTREPRDTSG
jgi:hypothetical protein